MNTMSPTFEDQRLPAKKQTTQRCVHRITAALVLAGAATVAKAGPYVYLPTPDPALWGADQPTDVNVPGIGSVTMKWVSPDNTGAYSQDSFSFPGLPYNNPAWVVGDRDLFYTAYDRTIPPKMTYTFNFATGLPTTGYLVFADFENGEAVSIKARDASNNLIPYSAFTLQQWDGEVTGGATLDYLTFSSGTNLPDADYSFQVAGKDMEGDNDEYLTWTLGFNTPIHTLELEFVFTYGSGRFNIAAPGTGNVPEPGTLALMALGLAGIGWGRHRRAVTEA